MKTPALLVKMCAAAMLTAIGVVIPMFSPVKFVLEPASFTLASHVPIFIATFISPGVALAVSAGTAAGFLLGGFPLVIVLRAASHIVFAALAGGYFKKNPAILGERKRLFVFSFVVGVIHAICELIVVNLFYFFGGMAQSYYAAGYAYSILVLVGVGTIVHSMVDFELALLVAKGIRRNKSLAGIIGN